MDRRCALEVLPVQLAEASGRVRLPPEELDDPHPGEPLLEERVEPGEPVADVAEGVSHPAAEDRGREPDQRNHREGDQRELDVDHQHHPHDGDEGEHVAEDRHHAGGEELVQRLDVGRHPGHQPADRIPVEVGDAEPLQMAEDLHPEVVHHPLADEAW